MKQIVHTSTWLVILAFFLVSCKKEGDVVPENISFTLSELDISIDHEAEDYALYLKNTGDAPFEWSVENTAPYLQISPSSGNIDVLDSIQIVLSIDRSNLLNQEYLTQIEINVNDEQSRIVTIRLTNFKELKWVLEDEIVDAEYSRSLNMIVAASSEPKLLLIDVLNRYIEQVELSAPATCVSVSPDGNYAITGHNGILTYVDLQNKEIILQKGLTFNVFDAILTEDNWSYLFPANGSWVSLYGTNLVTDEEVESFRNIHDKTKGRLHPSGDYIYGVSTNLTPGDIEKYSIEEGNAEILYDSPYHGDYYIGGDMWISSNDDFLIAKSGNIFELSEKQSEDIIYKTRLASDSHYESISFSSNGELIYGLAMDPFHFEDEADKILVFSKTYDLVKIIGIPRSLVERHGSGVIEDAYGQFGFFNTSESHYFVITKTGEGASVQWAIATFEVE